MTVFRQSAFILIFLLPPALLPAATHETAPMPRVRSQTSAPALDFYTKHEPDKWQKAEQLLPGDLFAFELRNLPPRKKVKVTAEWAGCRSQAEYETSDEGRLDGRTATALEGSYRGVDTEGLLWSMKCPKDGPAYDGKPLHLAVSVDGEEKVAGDLARPEGSADVQRTKVESDGVIGFLYQPKGKGPFPTIICLGGSEGGAFSAMERAQYLARHGYAALALPYFARHPEDVPDLKIPPGFPTKLEKIPLEYFGRAIAWLEKQPTVDAKRLGVWGISRGGELSLLVGAHYPQIRAVVSVVGSGVAGYGDDDGGAPWTYGGKVIAHLDPKKDVEGGEEVQARAMEAIQAQKADIAVEKTNGPVLLIAAAQDTLWPSVPLSRFAWKRLQEAPGRSKLDAFHILPSCGHSIAGLPGFPADDPLNKGMGGSDQGNNRGQRRSLELVEAFLKDALR